MQRKYAAALTLGTAISALALGYLVWWQDPSEARGTPYDPKILAGDFTAKVTNKYFTLKPGTKFVYENTSSKSRERIEVTVTKETKTVMGVQTTVVRVREWVGDKIKEDTRDYYAQDKSGNVWYFGETVNNYKDGKIVDHKGSWEAGVNGAKPGIIMQREPKVGQTYRQEYYKGKAEDMGTVIAVGKHVKVRYGTFDDCVQIRDWSRIDLTNEHKYYCAKVGFAVMEETAGLRAKLFGANKVELVSVVKE
jgi:hypothetical protein